MKRRVARARRPPVSKRWLIWAFFLCAGPVGLAAAWATPAMQVPDEATHTARAAGLLHGAVLATRRWAPDPAMGDYGWEAGVRSSVPLENVALSSTSHGPLSGTTTLKPLRLRRLFFYDLPNTAMYFPAAYVPAAAGIALVAALHGSAPAAFVAGRLGSLIAFLALGAAALSVAAFGEAVLLCVLLLPLVLLLAGSINQDGVLMAGTCFAVAALTRREAGWRLAGLAGLALLAAAKPPYAPLMGLYLLAPQAAGWRGRAVALIAAGALVAGWVMLTAATVMVPFHYMAPDTDLYGFYHPGPLYTGDRAAWFFLMDPGAQITDLRAHPLAIFSVVARTVMLVPPHLFGEWLGRFGRLPLPVGLWLGVPWALAAGAALLANRPSGRPAAVLAWLLLVGSFWAVMLSLYVDNTPVGALSLTGFETRYLLPLLPCVALTLQRRAWTWWGVAPVLALGVFDAVYLPVLIWRSYGG